MTRKIWDVRAADAILKSIDEEDTVDKYKNKLQAHVARLDNAQKVHIHTPVYLSIHIPIYSFCAHVAALHDDWKPGKDVHVLQPC
jgi:hypothetical protein